MAGVAITTSSICVGSRCPWVRAGVGAAVTQNVTDPSLGPRLLDDIAAGASVDQAMQTIITGRENIEYRQLLVVDTKGNTAHYTGTEILGTNAVVEGKACVAAGNLLSSTAVPAAMVASFESNASVHLAERLVTALQAGIGAGGEMGQVKSAALLVAHEQSWPLVDLRVDWVDKPDQVLRAMWEEFRLQMDDYTTRALNPSAAPSYGVPGDE